jgi:excisionase family DNA binding protein
MSSNIKIVKICEYCNQEFIAKTTTTICCSDNCSKRFYKLKIKNDKIAQAELKTEIKRKPKTFITEEEIKAIQAKKNLTLVEAAILLNITPLTSRRWTLPGKMNSQKVGKKWMFNIKQLENYIV